MVQFNAQILDLSIQYHGRVIRSLQEQPVNHEETKGYLARNKRTRLLKKELRSLMNNQDYSRKMNDNSEDKILSITNGFLQLQQNVQELQNTPGGCSTSHTIIFITTETSEQATKGSMNQNSTSKGHLYAKEAVHMD